MTSLLTRDQGAKARVTEMPPRVVIVAGDEDPARELDFLKWLLAEARKHSAEKQGKGEVAA